MASEEHPPQQANSTQLKSSLAMNLFNSNTAGNNFGNLVTSHMLPFYKQIDQLLKRDVDFSNNKDVEIIKRLLNSDDRSRKEVQVLKKAFGDLKFFMEAQDNLPAKDYTALIQELRCENYDALDTVFKFDDFGFKYYIILSGSVFVLVPLPDTLKKPPQAPQPASNQVLPQSTHATINPAPPQTITNNTNSSPSTFSAAISQIEKRQAEEKQSTTSNAARLSDAKKSHGSPSSKLFLSAGQTGTIDSNTSSQQVLRRKYTEDNKPSAFKPVGQTPTSSQQHANNSNNGSANPNNNNDNSSSKNIGSNRKIALFFDPAAQNEQQQQQQAALSTPQRRRSSAAAGLAIAVNTLAEKQAQINAGTSEVVTSSSSTAAAAASSSGIGIQRLRKLLLQNQQAIKEEEKELVIPKKLTEEHLTEARILERVHNDHPGYEIVRKLKVGDAFGEIALLNNARRTASIVCKEDTLMVTLSKQSYDKILSNYHQKKFMESVNFLKEFNLFASWQNSKINALYQSMEIRPVQYREIVFREGDPAEIVYFIKEGEFEISKAQKIKKPKQDDGETNNTLMKFCSSTATANEKAKLFMKVSVLGPGCSFGEEEIVLGSKRTCQVQCISSSDIENRVSWRENYEVKVMQTKRIFKEKTKNLLRPTQEHIENELGLSHETTRPVPVEESNNNQIPQTKKQSSKQLNFRRSIDPISVGLTSQTSLIPGAPHQSTTSPLSTSSPALIHHSSKKPKPLNIFINPHHTMKQVLQLKEENARTLSQSLKPSYSTIFPELSSSPLTATTTTSTINAATNNSVAQYQSNSINNTNNNTSTTPTNSQNNNNNNNNTYNPINVPLTESTIKAPGLTPSKPSNNMTLGEKNIRGQRVSINGHFISSLTDLELDFTKLTMKQASSPYIKNLIDPFYQPQSNMYTKPQIAPSTATIAAPATAAPSSPSLSPTNLRNKQLNFAHQYMKMKTQQNAPQTPLFTRTTTLPTASTSNLLSSRGLDKSPISNLGNFPIANLSTPSNLFSLPSSPMVKTFMKRIQDISQSNSTSQQQQQQQLTSSNNNTPKQPIQIQSIHHLLATQKTRFTEERKDSSISPRPQKYPEILPILAVNGREIDERNSTPSRTSYSQVPFQWNSPLVLKPLPVMASLSKVKQMQDKRNQQLQETQSAATTTQLFHQTLTKETSILLEAGSKSNSNAIYQKNSYKQNSNNIITSDVLDSKEESRSKQIIQTTSASCLQLTPMLNRTASQKMLNSHREAVQQRENNVLRSTSSEQHKQKDGHIKRREPKPKNMHGGGFRKIFTGKYAIQAGQPQEQGPYSSSLLINSFQS